MSIPSTIAIDGPAGSGKSAVAQRLAARLNYLYFDTGVMYRAVTLAALRAGISIRDEAAVSLLAQNIRIDVVPPAVADGRALTVIADGEDVTWAIRSKEVDANVSPVSTYRRVRQVLTEQMRRIGRRGRVVMVGRDIGTVVLPEADLKIYLDATVETRARRRFLENQERGETQTYDEILAAMRERDRIDSSRAIAPLRPADDARIVETTALELEGVVTAVNRLVFE
ncbi:MAG: (d)CMP kinase [Chloroflexi bacterium]|nr:(d)CMP kinase [Chloroflexota bacterium]